MCGIVGTISASGLYTSNLKIFNQLLFIDTLRGEDSTGVFKVNKTTEKFSTLKHAVAAPEFLQSDKYHKFTDKHYNYSMLIGHNRAATQGKVITRNAHPFIVGNTVGVHNGTLRLWKKHVPQGKNFEVDSEFLIWAIEHKGIKWVTENVEGAFGIIWYNKEDNKLRLIRNSERPLSYSISKDKKDVYFSSELSFTKLVLGRGKYKLNERFDHHILEVGKLYTFSTDGQKVTVEKEDMPFKDFFSNINYYSFTGTRGASTYLSNLDAEEKEDIKVLKTYVGETIVCKVTRTYSSNIYDRESRTNKRGYTIYAQTKLDDIDKVNVTFWAQTVEVDVGAWIRGKVDHVSDYTKSLTCTDVELIDKVADDVEEDEFLLCEICHTEIDEEGKKEEGFKQLITGEALCSYCSMDPFIVSEFTYQHEPRQRVRV